MAMTALDVYLLLRCPTLTIASSIALGIGLAAATGFRVFMPLLVASAAAYSGHLPLGASFAWLGTLPALIMAGRGRVGRGHGLLHSRGRPPTRHHYEPGRTDRRHAARGLGND